MTLTWNISDLAQLTESMWTLVLTFSQAAAPAFVTSVWQGGVVALCLSICLHYAPRTVASLRFALWAMAFALVVALGSLPLLAHFSSVNSHYAGSALGSETTVRPWLQFDIRWSALLVLAWTVASAYRAADLAIHARLLRKLWANARQVECNAWSETFSSSLAGRKIQVCTTDALERPGVIGFLAPRILIPTWIFHELTAAELEQIVLHEAEHLRRGDDWTNLLQKLALMFFPLNPALVWMERRLCREREMACDEGVISRTHAPRAYAACLTRLAESSRDRRAAHLSAATLSLGAWQNRPELVQRVHSILRGKEALGLLGRRTLFASLACLLIAGSVELAHCPQLIAFTRTPLTRETLAASSVPSRMPMIASSHQYVKTPDSESVGIHPNYRLSPTTRGLKLSPPSASEVKLDKPYKQSAINRLPVSERQETSDQGWIVLTTAEVRSSLATTSNDYGADTVLDEKYQKGTTRLLLRVTPQGELYPELAAVPTRAGWLIIQL